MSAFAFSRRTLERRWLRDARFDLILILGVLTFAAATGAFVAAFPHLLFPILIVDLWVLGYHHVISTYTRICFDWQSARSHAFLVFGLLPVIAIAVFVAWTFVGLWIIVTVYFYWQWFHYTRQSWGISRAYRGKDRDALYEDGALDQAIFYALPILGIVYRSEHPGDFFGLPLVVLAFPHGLTTACAAVGVPLLAYWVVRRLHAWRSGRLAVVHTLYVASHFAIFAIGYLLIDNLMISWLAVNIWHNAQYIMFVWLYNIRRFKDGVDPRARFLSYISQPQRLWLYLATCLAITGVIYWGLLGTLDSLLLGGIAGTIVFYQIVNFHHYIVDAVVWKLRSAPVRQTLGLAS
jgi:hypothetical protein